MSRLVPLLFLLTLWPASVAAAQDPVSLEIKGGDAKVVKVDKIIVVQEDRTLITKFPFTVQAPPGGLSYSWSVPAGVTYKRKGSSLEVTSAPKGELTVGVAFFTIEWEAKKTTDSYGEITVFVGEVPPTPPVPPGPNPPVPPPPNPPVPPVTKGIGAVLFVIGKNDPLTEAQTAVFFGPEVEQYLNGKLPAGPDGKTKQWRVYTDSTDTKTAPKVFKDLFERSKGKTLPYVAVTSPEGAVIYEGPAPASVQDALTLFKKYGG